MANIKDDYVFKLKGGEASTLEYVNPLLERREPIVVFFEDGRTNIKIGDGKNNYNSLPFISDTNIDISDVQGLTEILHQYEIDLENLNDKIDKIVIDEVYDPNSDNAQSGKAVAEAIETTVGRKTTEGGEIFNDYDTNKAYAPFATATGKNNTASGQYSFVGGGAGNIASGEGSASFNIGNDATGYASTAFGIDNTAFGSTSFVAGQVNTASGKRAASFGRQNTASGENSVTFGLHNTVEGSNSASFGEENTITSKDALVLGYGNTVSGNDALVSGYANTVSGGNGFASGGQNNVSGSRSFAANTQNKVLGENSAAFNVGNIVEGKQSAAFGEYNNVYAKDSIAAGKSCNIYAANDEGIECYSAFALGQAIKVKNPFQTAVGQFNNPNTDAIFVVGNGTENAAWARKNAFEVYIDGHAEVQSMGDNPNDKTVATKGYVDNKTANLDDVYGDIAELSEELTTAQNDIEDCFGLIDKCEEENAALSTDLAAVSTDVTELKTDIEEVLDYILASQASYLGGV